MDLDNKMITFGKLLIVATPIGNYGDISLRALEVLKTADVIACEEFREGSTLLKKLGIGEKKLTILNEHNDKEGTEEIIQTLLSGQNIALISDCGTPAFADPGTNLVKRCLEYSIPVSSIPGASSLMTAISLSPLPLKEFYFAGFLPRAESERREKLAYLKSLRIPAILMDTPYRMGKLLNEITMAFGKNRLVTLAVDLTMPAESLLHGSVEEISKKVKDRKGEFILIVY
jgi:16S rRNA (cytidine1402-2'-O)-methyltransferase